MGGGGSNQLGNRPTGNMNRHRKPIVLKLNPYTDLCGYNNGFRRIAKVEINLGQRSMLVQEIEDANQHKHKSLTIRCTT